MKKRNINTVLNILTNISINMTTRLIPAPERDAAKCEFYNKFYERNRKDGALVDWLGRTNEKYWAATMRYVEQKMRELTKMNEGLD